MAPRAHITGWCAGCKSAYPAFTRVASNEDMRKQFRFAKVNIEYEGMGPYLKSKGITGTHRPLLCVAFQSASRSTAQAVHALALPPMRAFHMPPPRRLGPVGVSTSLSGRAQASRTRSSSRPAGSG